MQAFNLDDSIARHGNYIEDEIYRVAVELCVSVEDVADTVQSIDHPDDELILETISTFGVLYTDVIEAYLYGELSDDQAYAKIDEIEGIAVCTCAHS